MEGHKVRQTAGSSYFWIFKQKPVSVVQGAYPSQSRLRILNIKNIYRLCLAILYIHLNLKNKQKGGKNAHKKR